MTTQITSNTWVQSIKNALYNAYQGIITKLKDPFLGLTKQLNQKQNPDLNKLNKIRQKHFDLITQEHQKTQTNFNEITKNITEDMKKYVSDMTSEEIKKLGPPPCEFSIFTLGSMARGESGPITDLEIGFILKEKSIKIYQYFYQLSQNLSDRIFLLGEHPDVGGKGLRMDEADNAPKHKKFFARNITREQEKQLVQEAILKKEWDKIPYEGSRPFIGTVDEIASYTKPGDFRQNRTQLNKIKKTEFNKEWQKALNNPKNKAKLKTKKGQTEIKNEIMYWLNEMYNPFNSKELAIADDAGKKLGRNFACLYGSTSLYNQFLTKKNQYLNIKQSGTTQRKFLAQDTMASDIQNIFEKGTSLYLTGTLGKTLDVKRELYRFVEQFATNLGFYHSCKTQNPIDILKELTQRNLITQTTAKSIIDFIEFAAGLKLKEQSILKRQGFAAYFDEQEFLDDKEQLEEKIDNLQKSINFLEKSNKQSSLLSIKKRAMVELQEKYEHMLDMAPSHIYSQTDIDKLNNKYAPLTKEIFELAQKWVVNPKKKLAFTPCALTTTLNTLLNQPNVAPVIPPAVIQAPMIQAPVIRAPMIQAPVIQAPVIQAPVIQAPVIQAPVIQAPVTSGPIVPVIPVTPALQEPNNLSFNQRLAKALNNYAPR